MTSTSHHPTWITLVVNYYDTSTFFRTFKWLHKVLLTEDNKVGLYLTGSTMQDANCAGHSELQLQYSNYKNSLQQLASKIGDIEQETEEHKLGIL